ncbi:hypothetical protein ENBRE01_1548 [Enteropsectra breve]|nr:hypothetical protein ENBRE01_1548 [Enteropsectra breve]
MPMEYSTKFIRIMEACRQRGYISSNAGFLRDFFEHQHHIDELKHALTCPMNVTALNIIEKLRINVMPILHINPNTYLSVFRLNKMKIIADSDFDSILGKFKIIKNYEKMFEDTEKDWIRYNIDRRRKNVNEKVTYKMLQDVSQMHTPAIEDAVVYIDLETIFPEYEDLIDGWEDYIYKWLHWDGLYTLSRDNGKNITTKSMALRGVFKSFDYSPRIYRYVFAALRRKEIHLKDIVREMLKKMAENNIEYYFCGKSSLGILLFLAISFLKPVDHYLEKVISLQKNDFFPTDKKILYFSSKEGGIGFEYMENTLNRLIENKSKSI